MSGQQEGMRIEQRGLVIVPAYNEESTIPRVIEALHNTGMGLHVLVVDDGSTDATARVAAEAGATVVSLPFNLGIGGAVQTGYLFAREGGYDVAVQVDADGQHLPDELPKLLGPLQRGEADLVAGTRFRGSGRQYRSGLFRRAGILYFSWLLSAILRRRITDPTSGFRAANRRVIELFARDYPTDYPEVDSLVLLWKSGLRSEEVPVRMDPRRGGRSSISWLGSFYYVLKVSLSVGVHLLRAPRTIR